MASKSVDDTVCDICKKKGKLCKGVLLCIHCREIYCHTCSDFHQTFTATKSHTLIEIYVENKLQNTTPQIKMEYPQVKMEYTQVSSGYPCSPKVSGALDDTMEYSDQASPEEEYSSDFLETVTSLKYCGKMRCQLPDDTNECWIWAMSSTNDGYIVMLDYKNSALKLFDGSFENKYQAISSTTVSSRCTGMTISEDNDIAVTCGNRIQFYKKHSTELKLQQRVFKLPGFCWSIAYANKRYAATCDPYKTNGSIYILDSAGQKINQIESLQADDKKVIMSHYMTLDPQFDKLYISDTTNALVVCTTFYGIVLWFFKDIPSPLGLVPWNNTLLVANHSKHEINQFSNLGHSLGTFATQTNGIAIPELLTVSSEGDYLLITGKGTDIVKMYPLL